MTAHLVAGVVHVISVEAQGTIVDMTRVRTIVPLARDVLAVGVGQGAAPRATVGPANGDAIVVHPSVEPAATMAKP